jgi:hypothetical protein
MHAPILTNHARERLKERWITEDAIASVLRSPERTVPGAKPDTVKFIRTLNDRQVQVVGKYLPDQDRWLVLSVWVRGEEDQAPLTWRIISFPVKLLAKGIVSLINALLKKPQ